MLSSLDNFRTLANIIWPQGSVYSSFPPYDSLVSLPVLLQVEHSFDCCGIVACFEFRKPEGPIVVLCSQDCFCSLGFSSVA